MLIFTKQADLKAHLKSIFLSNSTIGFVPTMGALHQGHLSLIVQSLKENTTTVTSIFVNPTQFNNANDLDKYPRTFDADLEKIKKIADDVILYAPTVDDIYQGKTVSESFNFDGLENQMEGMHRPGHFDGVGTIVKILFKIINPNNAYFGEKDFQQLQIIKKMVEKNKFQVNVIGRPIFREDNGLAMSSRNERLSAAEKEKAALIFKTLLQTKEKFGTKSAQQIKQWVEKLFKTQSDFKLDYFQIADENTLLPCLRKNRNKKYRAFIAVFINDVRLIDTISLN